MYLTLISTVWNTSPWEHSLVQDIMRVFHECGLIKVSLEYIAGSRLKFTGKFSLRLPLASVC